MSPAGKSEDADGSGAGAEETSVMMRPVSEDGADENAQDTQTEDAEAGSDDAGRASETSHAGNGSAKVVQSEDLEESADVPPWQRATSEVRQPEAESGYVPVSGQPSGGDGHRSGQEDRYGANYPGARAGSGSSAENTRVLYADQEQTATNLQPVPAAPSGDSLYSGSEPPPRSSYSGGRSSVDLGATSSSRHQPSGATPSALRRPGRGPRRASLQVKRVDPWSVLKLALVLSIAMFFVWLVAVGVLYGVLDGMGVWDKMNGTYSDLVESGASADGAGGPLISAGRVFGIAAIIGGINIILFTALSTVAAFIYNVSADLAGGLELTLAERE